MPDKFRRTWPATPATSRSIAATPQQLQGVANRRFARQPRSGARSWWLAVNHMDSNGQPAHLRNALAGVPASLAAAQAIVTGAARDNNNAGQPWWILGTGTQYHTRQDYAKSESGLRLLTDGAGQLSTFGLWRTMSTSRQACILSETSATSCGRSPPATRCRQLRRAVPARCTDGGGGSGGASWTGELSAGNGSGQLPRLPATLFAGTPVTRSVSADGLRRHREQEYFARCQRRAHRDQRRGTGGQCAGRGHQRPRPAQQPDLRRLHHQGKLGFVATPGDTIGKWQPNIPKWRATALASYRINSAWTATGGPLAAPSTELEQRRYQRLPYQGVSRFFAMDSRVVWKSMTVTAAVGVATNNYKVLEPIHCTHSAPTRVAAGGFLDLTWSISPGGSDAGQGDAPLPAAPPCSCATSALVAVSRTQAGARRSDCGRETFVQAKQFGQHQRAADSPRPSCREAPTQNRCSRQSVAPACAGARGTTTCHSPRRLVAAPSSGARIVNNATPASAERSAWHRSCAGG